MSIFCSLDEETIKDLNNAEEKFEKGIKKLNSDEKDFLLMHMYKLRHNLLINLVEEKNKNLLLVFLTCACAGMTAYILF